MDTVIKDFDTIINQYLEPYNKITKHDIDTLVMNTCCDQYDAKLVCDHFKIINNKLYHCNKPYITPLITRTEPFMHMILETLKIYDIRDCEFVAFNGDAINNSNIDKCVKNNNILPLIVTTSVLNDYNMILCPDFTFSFSKDYDINNNEEMCKQVVDMNETIEFKNKINKMVWRGAGNTYYRSRYLFNDETLFDMHSVGGNERTFENNKYMTRLEKSNYKYYLHLNGHEGDDIIGAYSSAFKWGLMNKSVVFYSAPTYYREFWQHPCIFREKEHFMFSNNTDELLEQYDYILNNEDIAEQIANQSFDFFKKYLLNYDNIKYYMQKLLNEYANRMDYIPTVNPDDELITDINKL